MNQSVINTGKKIIPQSIRIFFRKLNWKWHYFLQKPSETKVYCPIAKQEFKAFAHVSNALVTPTNGAKGRQRLVWHYLENEIGILKNDMTVLHTAPEYSLYPLLKGAKNLSYFPGDKMVDGYSNQSGILNIDLTELTFDDATFDCVISNHVLEHIPDDRKAMSEILRVLKVGGNAIITVPINESLTETLEDPSIQTAEDRKKHYGQWDHVRWYSTDIKERLESVGFEVELIRYARQFSAQDVAKFGFKDNIIIRATKKA